MKFLPNYIKPIIIFKELFTIKLSLTFNVYMWFWDYALIAWITQLIERETEEG